MNKPFNIHDWQAKQKQQTPPKWIELYGKFSKAFYDGEVGLMISIYNKYTEISKNWELDDKWEFMNEIGDLKRKYKDVKDALNLFDIFEKLVPNLPPLVTRTDF